MSIYSGAHERPRCTRARTELCYSPASCGHAWEEAVYEDPPRGFIGVHREWNRKNYYIILGLGLRTPGSA